jgi:hypothetical protein
MNSKKHSDLRIKFAKSRNKIARSKYAEQVVTWVLTGEKGPIDIVRWLREHGQPVSVDTLKRFREKCIDTLSDDVRREIVQEGWAENGGKKPNAGDEEADYATQPTVYALKRSIRAVAKQITEMEKVERPDLDHRKSLMDHVKLLITLRKDLAHEQVEADLARMRDKTIEDVAKIALEFIPDAEKSKAFGQKIVEYERG